MALYFERRTNKNAQCFLAILPTGNISYHHSSEIRQMVTVTGDRLIGYALHRTAFSGPPSFLVISFVIPVSASRFTKFRFLK